MSEQQWVAVFRDCLESPDRSHLIRANVSFDFRASAGSLDVAPPLVAVLREVKDHPGLLRLLARSATGFKPPLGFRGALVVDRSGEGAPGIDLKHGGTTPIVNLARFFALSNGITISSTIDRLQGRRGRRRARRRDRLGAPRGVRDRDADPARAPRGADRGRRRARQRRRPGEPSRRSRAAQLREAFRAVAHAQKRLSVYTPLGV